MIYHECTENENIFQAIVIHYSHIHCKYIIIGIISIELFEISEFLLFFRLSVLM